MSDPVDVNERLEAAAIKAEGASEIMRRVANDPVGTLIDTESGQLPSLAEWYEQLENVMPGIPGRLDDLEQFELTASTTLAALMNNIDPAKGAAMISWVMNATGAVALTQAAKNAECVSVATFGVTGVGDDTAAMIKAINWQLSQRQTYNPIIGGVGGGALVTVPTLTIPKGWRVKVQGNLPIPTRLVAHGGLASIESLDNTKDIFKGDDSYMSHFADLNFLGGMSQVRLQNSNINGGLWLFERCTFEGSNDYSAQCLNTSGSYPVTSTQPIFMNCRWIRCKRALKTQADHTYVIGGWMQPEGDFFDADTAFIYAGGLLTMNLVMTIPGGTFPSRARWIDCYGAVRCQGTRFGGEGGGLPIVYWFAPPPRYTSGTAQNIEMGVSLHQCSIYQGNNARPDSAVVNCRGQLPTIVRITDCTGGITKPYIVNESAANGGIPDITAYLENLKVAWNGDDLYGEFSFHFTGNKTKKLSGTSALWPAELDTYVYTDRPYVAKIGKIKTPGTASAPTGATTPISLDTTDSDPYGLKAVESSTTTCLKAPAGARWAVIKGFIQIASHTSNNQIYNLRLYKSGVAVPDGYANYTHSTTGVVRISVSETVPCTVNDTFTLRFFQASGNPLTIEYASMSIEFK